VLIRLVLSWACLLSTFSLAAQQLSDHALHWYTAPADATGPTLNGHASAYPQDLHLETVRGDLSAFSIFLVYAPAANSQREQLLYRLRGLGEDAAVLTTHRLAQPNTGRYQNFQDTLYTPARLHSHVGRSASPVSELKFCPHLISDLPVEPFAGTIAELIIFDVVLSPSERRRVETYLATKYGLTLQEDYLDRRGNTVQSIANAQHRWRVMGIGKDAYFGFRQNRSHSIYDTNLVQLSVDGSSISQEGYLMLADDNASLALAKPAPLAPQQTQRSWRLSPTDCDDDLPVKVAFDTTELLHTPQAQHSWWLLQQDENLGISTATLYPARDFSSRGPRFAVRPETSTLHLVYDLPVVPNVKLHPPSCSTGALGKLELAVAALHFPVQYELRSEAGQSLFRGELSSPLQTEEIALTAGAYALSLIDADGYSRTERWFFQANDAPAIDLQANYVMREAAPLALELKLPANDEVMWSTVTGNSLGYGHYLTVHEPGDYRVQVDREGCVAEHRFTVGRQLHTDNIAHALLRPNPTTDGQFQLQVRLRQPASASVSISDAAGRELFAQALDGEAINHRFRGVLRTPGVYFVRFTSRESVTVKQLVVQ